MPPHSCSAAADPVTVAAADACRENRSAPLVTCGAERDPLLDAAAEELEGLRVRRRLSSHAESSSSSLEGPCCSADPRRHRDDDERLGREEAFFPRACLEMMYRLPGNDRCVDCDAPNPEWASVSYGALMCLKCSGAHRSLGVKTSFVRSVLMDTWSHEQILAMLEGGNQQLSTFFDRHSLSRPTSTAGRRTDRVSGVTPRSSAATTSTHEEVREGRSSTGSRSSFMTTTTHYRYRTRAALFYREELSLHASGVAGDGRYRGRKAARRRSGRRRGSSGRAGRRNTV